MFFLDFFSGTFLALAPPLRGFGAWVAFFSSALT